MKKLALFVAVAMCAALTASAAFAAPPKPPRDCGIDKDGDGWCVKDMSRNDAAGKPGFIVGPEDCNDADPKVHPGAREIVGDGIDQDCDGADAIAPAYAKAFCGSSPTARCLKVMEAEIKACDGKPGCAVNYSAGKFVTGFGAYFIDTDCDGVRELLDQVGKEAYDAKVRQGHRCVRATPPAKKAASKKTPVKKSADKSGAASDADKSEDEEKSGTELDKKVAGLAEEVTKTTGRVDGLEKRVGDVETVLADGTKRLDGLDKALADEAKAREEADKAEREAREVADRQLNDGIAVVKEEAATAHRTAVNARERANLALASGVHADVGVSYLLKSGQGVAIGSRTLRGPTAHSVLFTGRVGAELPSVIIRGVGGVGTIAKEGSPDGGGLIFKGGAETCVKIGVHCVGVGVGYLHHTSGGKVSGASAESRGGYGELIYELSPIGGDGNVFRLPLRVSLGAGYEALGTRGKSGSDEFKADGKAPFVMFSLGIGVGVGSTLR